MGGAPDRSTCTCSSTARACWRRQASSRRTTLDELIAAAASTDDRRHQGPVRRQRRWRRPARRLSAVVRRRRLPHRGRPVRLRQRAVYASFAKFHELFESDSLLLGAPTDWFDPGCVHQRADGDAAHRAVDVPADHSSREVGEDFDVIAWPRSTRAPGRRRCRIGAFSSTVSSRSVDVDASKAFVQWLWVDQTD